MKIKLIRAVWFALLCGLVQPAFADLATDVSSFFKQIKAAEAAGNTAQIESIISRTNLDVLLSASQTCESSLCGTIATKLQGMLSENDEYGANRAIQAAISAATNRRNSVSNRATSAATNGRALASSSAQEAYSAVTESMSDAIFSVANDETSLVPLADLKEQNETGKFSY